MPNWTEPNAYICVLAKLDEEQGVLGWPLRRALQATQGQIVGDAAQSEYPYSIQLSRIDVSQTLLVKSLPLWFLHRLIISHSLCMLPRSSIRDISWRKKSSWEILPLTLALFFFCGCDAHIETCLACRLLPGARLPMNAKFKHNIRHAPDHPLEEMGRYFCVWCFPYFVTMHDEQKKPGERARIWTCSNKSPPVVYQQSHFQRGKNTTTTIRNALSHLS
jgi:hypothetical protein